MQYWLVSRPESLGSLVSENTAWRLLPSLSVVFGVLVAPQGHARAQHLASTVSWALCLLWSFVHFPILCISKNTWARPPDLSELLFSDKIREVSGIDWSMLPV